MSLGAARGLALEVDGWIAAVRQVVAARGPGALPIDALRRADLVTLDWAGDATHLRYVADELARVPSGAIDYLAVRAPSGRPVAAGAVQYAVPASTAKLLQLVTHPELRSLGIGACLIGALEQLARTRRHGAMALAVEASNPRAEALYERLGYQLYGSEDTGWEQQDAAGRVYWHATRCRLLRKDL